MSKTNLGYKSTIDSPFGVYYLRIVDDKLIDPSGKYATYNSLLKVAANQLVVIVSGIDEEGNINAYFLAGMGYSSLIGKYATGFVNFFGDSLGFDSTTPDGALTYNDSDPNN